MCLRLSLLGELFCFALKKALYLIYYVTTQNQSISVFHGNVSKYRYKLCQKRPFLNLIRISSYDQVPTLTYLKCYISQKMEALGDWLTPDIVLLALKTEAGIYKKNACFLSFFLNITLFLVRKRGLFLFSKTFLLKISTQCLTTSFDN